MNKVNHYATRKLLRLADRKWGSINTIQPHLRSANPRALAQRNGLLYSLTVP